MADRLLVIGGAGFIGSNFVRLIAARYPKTKLCVFDSLAYAGTLDSIRGLEEAGRVEFIHGDLRDRHQVQAAVSACDAVVNFAAHSHVDRSIVDATPFMETNAVGVQVLLDSLHEVGGRRFLQVSTDELYGDAPPNRWFTEADLLHPSNPYSASKAAADMLVLAYVRTHGVDAVITRCTNNYGPWQYPEKLVAMCITSIMEGRKVPVHGDGMMFRDWIWVDDHCDAIDRVLRGGLKGEVYNVAGLCERSTSSVVEAIASRLNRSFSDVVERIPDRPGNDRRYAISPGKIMSALGWRPGPSFEDRLPELVAWYREHRAWWLHIMQTPHYKLHHRKLRSGR